MREYIIRRLLLVAPIMVGVSFLTYATFSIIPGDAAVLICQFNCTPETLKDIRHDLGLDKPFYEQYGDWLGGIFKGDLGESFFTHLPVTTELGQRLPVTGELVGLSLTLALLLGIPPGVLSAIRPGTPLDWVARFVSVIWLSVPSFYLATLIIAFGAAWFHWSPPQFGSAGTVSLFEDPWLNLQTFFFPSIVLAVGISAVIMRLTRSSMLEVMRNDYIRTAWSKGLRERAVVWRHALKNAMIPVATIIGLQLGALIGGAVIIESVFNLNGIGKYLLEAILRRDLLVVQSLVLMFAVVYIVANLIVDLAYAWLDPRIRYG
ncbi:MAG: ABC transporter permease [Dehalococcoidia bacterium]|nr:ABC transporter permease [Dehalococcoidia bacterium]